MKQRTPETHSEQLVEDFAVDSKKKYKKGQEEHGGELWRKPVIDMLGEEIIDQWSYYHVFREQWETLKKLLGDEVAEYTETPRGVPVPERVQQAYNMLEYGNVEGERTFDIDEAPPQEEEAS